MGMQINTNIAALNSYRNLSNTQNDLSKSLEKLSSGLRINRAADDAAGLAISEGLRAQVGGLTVAARNAQDGISVIQTAEGSLTEVHSILQRMRDLAVQSGNDSNNDESRKAITGEANQLVSELGRIAESTNFNGINLLNGTDFDSVATGTQSVLSFQVGAGSSSADQITVNLASANVAKIASTLAGGATFAFDTSAAGATTAMKFDGLKADGATALSVTTGAISIAQNATADDVVAALNADSTFNASLQASVVNGEVNVKSLEGGTISTVTPTGGGAAGTVVDNGAGILFTSAEAAKAAITAIDTQITGVSTARADLGAVQNRFESTINSLNVSKENLSAAESRIRDTDMASEMVNYTRANILSQAGTAMLAQANQSNQGVLQLLR